MILNLECVLLYNCGEHINLDNDWAAAPPTLGGDAWDR